MNSLRSNCKAAAFTLVEMLCVIAIIAILAAMLLPVVTQGTARARRVQCVSQLHQTGIAFHAFAHDHRDRFPMEVPVQEGGSLEFVQSGHRVAGEFYFSFRHFQSLAPDLVTPRVLWCPAERTRAAADTFAEFSNEHLSYFVGATARPREVNAILAGDGNITNDASGASSILRHTVGNPVRWTHELHRYKGNLLFADGRVEESSDRSLASGGQVLAMQELIIPSRPPAIVRARAAAAPRDEPHPTRSAAPALEPQPVASAQIAAGDLELSSEPSPVSYAYASHTSRTIPAPDQPDSGNSAPEISAAVAVTLPAAEAADPARRIWFLFLLLLLIMALMSMLRPVRRQRS